MTQTLITSHSKNVYQWRSGVRSLGAIASACCETHASVRLLTSSRSVSNFRSEFHSIIVNAASA